MLTVELTDVETGPATTIASMTIEDARSINFSKTGIIIIETEDGSIREIDVDSVSTVTVTVSGTDLTFEIAG